MKSIKKLVLGFSAVVLMLFATPLSVSAEVTSNEQRIITALHATRITEKYITLAKQHLASANVNLDEKTVDLIVANIKEASDLVGDGSLSKFLANSPKADRFISLIVEAGKAVNFQITVNVDSYHLSTINGISLSNLLSGSKSVEDVIRNTGSNFSGSLIVAAGIITLLGITTFVAKKKELF